jgi:bifunctional DNA-binding transcriptional regulator/antitoxin component of YhaV-PrlF toxin-antitoxin module
MNNLVTYGQTFSKGQLTIPKKFRDHHGLGDNFAYKMTHQDKKIIIEPQEQPKKKSLAAALAKIKEPIFSDADYQDYLQMRKDNESRMIKLGL